MPSGMNGKNIQARMRVGLLCTFLTVVPALALLGPMGLASNEGAASPTGDGTRRTARRAASPSSDRTFQTSAVVSHPQIEPDNSSSPTDQANDTSVAARKGVARVHGRTRDSDETAPGPGNASALPTARPALEQPPKAWGSTPTRLAQANPSPRPFQNRTARQIETELRRLGVTYYFLEATSAEPINYRFYCEYADDVTAAKRVFDKNGSNPVGLMNDALRMVRGERHDQHRR